ncbi:MAG: tetratricopeptide repeat protein [Deltaproteobacteria bacterium]|nr:tetratricopeptide repeat protein [Candidatus Tharpella sp.]
MLRIRNFAAWLLVTMLIFSWQPLFSNQSGEGLHLPEVVVIGEDSARLEGFRDFGLLPALAPGIKLEPVADKLTLEVSESRTGPNWETAAAQTPGCAYRNPVTASLARGFGGVESYYRSGRQKYLDGLLDEAKGYFRAGLKKFKNSELVPDFHYWLAEIAFRDENYSTARRHFAFVTESTTNRFYHFSCYSLAWLDYREKEYQEAVKWFTVAAQSLDQRLSAAALFWKGEALFHAGQPKAGRLTFLRLTDGYPEAAEYRVALYRLATISFNQRDYQTALSYLEALPESVSGSDMLQRQADLARGWCLYFLGIFGDAQALFRGLESDIASVDDVVPLAFLGEILSLLKQKKLIEARHIFDSRPDELQEAAVAAAALRELTAAYLESEEYEEATVLGQRLITSFPVLLVQADDYRRLARLQTKLGDNDKALETLGLGIEVFDGNAARALRLEQAQVLLVAGEPDKALVILEGLFAAKEKILPSADLSLMYLLLARSLNRLEKFPQTLSLLLSLPIDCAPSARADLLYERAWAALKNNEFDWAINDFSVYLGFAEETGKSPLIIQNAEINRAEALFNQHRDRKSEEALDRFVERYPQSPFLSRAQNYRGLIALRQGEFEEAAAIFTDLLAPESGIDAGLNAEILDNLGESLFSLEKFPEAIKTYQRLIDKYPGDEVSGRALIRMGESYFNLGDYLKAQLVYLDAKRSYSGGPIDEKASYGMLLLAYNQDKFSYLEIEVKNFIARFPESSYTVPLMLLLTDLYQRQGRQADLVVLLKQLEKGDYAGDLALEALYRHFKLDLDKGRQKEARDDCRRLLKRFPLSKYECDCRLFLARYAFAEKDLEAALATLSGLSEACPDPGLKRQVTLLMAEIYQQQGDFANARSHYLAVIDEKRRDNSAFVAFVGLGTLFAEQEKFDEALFFYDKAVKNPLLTEAAAAALARAAVLEKAGRISEAQQSYLRLSYLFPKQEKLVADALLAVVRLAQKEKDEQTLKKMTEKLNSIPLTEVQKKELKYLLLKM